MANPFRCATCGRETFPGQTAHCPTCGAVLPPYPDREVELVTVPLRLGLDDDPALLRLRGIPPPPRPFRAVRVPLPPERPRVGPPPCVCRECGGHNRHDAATCHFCGRELDVEDAPWKGTRHPPFDRPVRRDCEPHRGDTLRLLALFGLVPVLGLPFAVAAWVMGSHDLKQMSAGLMDPEGWWQTRSSMTQAVAGMIISGICLLLPAALVLLAVAGH